MSQVNCAQVVLHQLARAIATYIAIELYRGAIPKIAEVHEC